MKHWTVDWTIHAASTLAKGKLGCQTLPLKIKMKQDGNNFVLSQGANGVLSPRGTTQAIFFPASLGEMNDEITGNPYVNYVLSYCNKAKLAQGDPIRLEGVVVGADKQSHTLTVYQVFRGDSTNDYLVAVLDTPNTNPNGVAVGR
jgi:hypothetical protein